MEANENFQKLSSLGFNVFFSEESLKGTAGISYINSIQEALVNSQHLILLSTTNSMTSGWVEAEYQTFFNECYLMDKQKRKFIILKGKDFDFQKIPPLFKRLQFADDITNIANILADNTPFSETPMEDEAKTDLSTFEIKSTEPALENSFEESEETPIKSISEQKNDTYKFLKYRKEYLLIIIAIIGFFIPVHKVASGGIWLQIWYLAYCFILTLILFAKRNSLKVMVLFTIIGLIGVIVPIARINFFHDGWARYYLIVFAVFFVLVFVLNRMILEKKIDY